jgi:hypothetical protein
VSASQITAAGQLEFKIPEGGDWRLSDNEMAQVSPGSNDKKALLETGFQKILVKGKLGQLSAPIAFFQELKPLMIQFVQLVICYVIQERAFKKPEGTIISEGSVSLFRGQCFSQLALGYDRLFKE